MEPGRRERAADGATKESGEEGLSREPDSPEVWLRGPLAGVDPLVAPVLYSFQQTREDRRRYTAGLTADQLWARPFGLAPLGFHIRHIAGSVDRLTTYLQGRGLDEAQMRFLAGEMEPGEGLSELLGHLAEVLDRAGAVIRGIDPATLRQPRYVGRLRLPTTVAGLLTHIAEHTQRHFGAGDQRGEVGAVEDGRVTLC